MMKFSPITKSYRADFKCDQLELRVRHLVVKDENAMNQAWDRLQKGEFFEQGRTRSFN